VKIDCVLLIYINDSDASPEPSNPNPTIPASRVLEAPHCITHDIKHLKIKIASQLGIEP